MQTLSEPHLIPESDKPSAGKIPALEPYLAQLVLVKAAELARAGQYQEAEDLISGLQEGKDSPVVLDLLARMRAQQGRWLEAETFWKQALQQDPTNPAYLEGLQYIQRTRRPSRLSRFFSPTFLLLILSLVVLLLVAQGVKRLVILENGLQDVSQEVGSVKGVLSQPQPTLVIPTQVVQSFPVEELATLRQEVQDDNRLSQVGLESLQKQVGEIQVSQAEILSSLKPTPNAAPEITLAVPGVQLLVQDDHWVIQFEEGLFPYGWALSQPARQTLDDLSLQLKPLVGKVEISIVGFKSSDEQDEYFDLGLMRAVVVLDYLESSGQLPADLFRIQPQGDTPPPFSNDTVANRGRNRTVIMILQVKSP